MDERDLALLDIVNRIKEHEFDDVEVRELLVGFDIDSDLEDYDATLGYFPPSECDVDKPFLMLVNDVTTVDRGAAVCGWIERGAVKIGDSVEIIGIKSTCSSTVIGISMSRNMVDTAQSGDNVGILLRGVDRKDIERGQVIAKPGSITPHTEFKAEVHVRSDSVLITPLRDGYCEKFYFRMTGVDGSIELPKGVEMVSPGDNATMTVKLYHPIAIEKEQRFDICDDYGTVGSGVVTEIIK